MGCAIAHELREDRLIASIHCDERVSDMAGKKHAGNKGANSEALNRASAVRTARKSVLELLGMSIVPAVLSLLFDMTVVMGGASQGTLSVVATAVLLIATIAVIAFEVRAYRRIIAVEDSVEMSDKILLGATLWFAGGLPQCLVSLVRTSMAGGDLSNLLIQTGVSVALLVLAAARFARTLRG